jgi:hypothetical protein
MAFPTRAIEWRRVGDKNSPWHFFIMKQTSICSRVTSNGSFDYVETTPCKKDKICKFCLRDVEKIVSRMEQVK